MRIRETLEATGHFAKRSGLLALSFFLLCLGCAAQSPAGNIADDLGRTVSIHEVPLRVVSLAPSNTEILFALGLDEKVVGVTEYCNYPKAATAKLKIGGFSTVDVEKVVSLTPDLILAAPVHARTVVPSLEKLGLTVFVLAPADMEGVFNSIRLVGRITGQEKRALQLVEDINARAKAVTVKTESLTPDQKPKVLYLTWHDPMFTAGTGTLAHDLISKAGGQNIASDIAGDKNIDLETVVYRNPQVIIASVNMGAGEDLTWQYVNKEPRLKNTDALKYGRVYKIDGDLVHRPGPRAIEGLEDMARFIHPELFTGTR